MKHSLTRRLAGRAATVGTAVALLVGMHGVAGAGASTLGGTATITNPSNNTPLPSGGSATNFTVGLPAQAACTGDSANGTYHVFSFLVQAGTDVSTLTFTAHPSAGIGLFRSTGSYYGPANTANAVSPATTGQIIGIPTDFQFSQLTDPNAWGAALGDILYTGGTSGVWEAGLACAQGNNAGHVSDYWTTEVTFTASGSDPNGFVWAAVPGPAASTPEVPLPLLLPILAAAVFGGAIVINRRRRSQLTTASVSASS